MHQGIVGVNIPYLAGFFDGEGSVALYVNGIGSHFIRTQLTQNVTAASMAVMNSLIFQYGGNVSTQTTLSGGLKYNWQVNGNGAADFLRSVLPWLIIKRDQAELALVWHNNRPPAARDSRGRMTSRQRPVDREVGNLLKRLKRQEAYRDEELRLELVVLTERLKRKN